MMAETKGTETQEAAAPPRGRGRRGLLLGAAAAVMLGAGGFYSAFAGLLPIGDAGAADEGAADADGAVETDIDFVAIEPLVVPLGPAAADRYLRFNAEIEVDARAVAAVAKLMPRVRDVLNGYLRAVEIDELEGRGALILLRAEMLRRVRMVAGESRVRDLLITEFVLN